MYKEKCPVCNSEKRHARFAQLCGNCGWEFRVFWEIPQQAVREHQVKELEARLAAMEKKKKRIKEVQKLEEEIQNSEVEKEKLFAKIRQAEEATKTNEEVLERRQEVRYQELSIEVLQSEVARINEKLPLLRQLWRQKHHIEGHAILNCSIKDKTLKINSDRMVENPPDLILGFSEAPFFLIETAEVHFRVRLNGTTIEPDENINIPLPSLNNGTYYWRIGLFNSDSGRLGYRYQLFQDCTEKIKY